MHITRKLRVFLVLATLVTAGFVGLMQPQTAAAANPTTISFQGKVVKADGTNVTDGTYPFTFKLYSVASGGTAIWGETQASVTVTSGVFQVNLGSTCSLFTTQTCSTFSNTAIDFSASPTLYLGITFNNDAAGEMTPRPQLQSVPYAFNADNATKLGNIAASSYAQLSPASQQTGFINVNGNGTFGGNLAVTGTYNGNTFSSSALTFSAASANTISGTSGQSLTVQSQGTGQLLLNSASGTLGLTSTTSTIQRTAVGTTNLDLNDTANTLLSLANSGTGVANLNLVDGSLETGAVPTIRLDNSGNLTNIGNYTSTGGITGGELNDSQTDTTGTTYTEATAKAGYYLSATSAATNAAITSTFNITGLPATDGAMVAITAVSAKGVTTASRVHTTIVQIAGTTIATLPTLAATTAQTTQRAFIVMRMNAVWQVIGEGPTAALGSTSTVNTADYAEWIPYSGDTQPQPGDVLTVGDNPTSVKRSTTSYDSYALGVVSTTPYQTAGVDDGHSVIIALTGRVPVNVSLENGPIALGDKLTASSTPGVAMKATRAGHIIGTALSAYDGSQSSAQVMVQLGVGYDVPPPTSSIINAALISNGGLTIDSGTSGTVTVDSSAVDGSAAIGITNAAGVSISKPGQTTTVAGALVIDQSTTFHGAVTLDGANADTLLSARNFSLNSAGDVSTRGSFISKGGSLQMLDASGASLFTIDTSGNASLAGDLNLASASISGGLSVGGDVTIGGLSTFQKLATFLAKTVFKQNVEFAGHITVAADSAGYATLRQTESTVHVKFATSYDNPPVVTANTIDGQFTPVAVANITKDGFDITVATPVAKDTQCSWTAVGVSNPRTATNPLPTLAQ